MLDTDLYAHELAERLDQLATELCKPSSAGTFKESANDHSVAALLWATTPQLARAAAGELRRARQDVQRLRTQLRQRENAQRRIDAACQSTTELVQQLQANAEVVEGSAQDVTLRMKVQALPLSVRCQNVLAREGVQTVEQLLACTERRLLGMVNLGQRSVFDIKQVLEAMGLRLGTT